MVNEEQYSKAVSELRGFAAGFKPGQKTYDEIVKSRDEVLARYRPIFSSEHIPSLTKEEFTSFLYIENNHHWSGLYRTGLGAAQDMNALRQAFAVLLDENRPIQERFPKALDPVTGLGKGIATAILTVAYPAKYGVWNNTSEAALRKVGLWPDFARGTDIGGRYAKINALLARLALDLEMDFWTLDTFWWFILEPVPPISETTLTASPIVENGGRFALERQLEEFLLENWERTPLAREWVVFSTPDDSEAGNQYPTDVGRIDILAVHKTQPRFLVVELKRNQSSDQTIGQTLRYIGWVRKHLAKDGQSVEGLIIAHKMEEEARYAISTLPNVRMMTYEVEFRLKEC
jgi:hypothetical protein